ncbi:MAG TPA: hypothetical protein VEC15_07230 [Actinomycetota bacterium]|nr:hypothetical protein [Actinomycetota bacterium]
MRTDPHLDLEARPETYWPDEPSLEQRVGRIRGLYRRRRALDMLEAGTLDADDPILTPALRDDVREAASATHPLLMGGEYLPDVEEETDEVEIARIELLSTTGDTYSIRARKAEGAIAYRMVDEYSNGFDLGTSAEPLALGELIARLEGVDIGYAELGVLPTIPECFLEENLRNEVTVEELRHFVTVTSPFYRELEPYYRGRSVPRRVAG